MAKMPPKMTSTALSTVATLVGVVVNSQVRKIYQYSICTHGVVVEQQQLSNEKGVGLIPHVIYKYMNFKRVWERLWT